MRLSITLNDLTEAEAKQIVAALSGSGVAVGAPSPGTAEVPSVPKKPASVTAAPVATPSPPASPNLPSAPAPAPTGNGKPPVTQEMVAKAMQEYVAKHSAVAAKAVLEPFNVSRIRDLREDQWRAAYEGFGGQ